MDDEEFTTKLTIDAESTPEALGEAVKMLLTQLSESNHGLDDGEEVGSLVSGGYKIVVYINEPKNLH